MKRGIRITKDRTFTNLDKQETLNHSYTILKSLPFYMQNQNIENKIDSLGKMQRKLKETEFDGKRGAARSQEKEERQRMKPRV